MKAGRPAVPVEEIARILELVESGYNDAEVGAHVGRPRETVWRIRTQHGLKARGRRQLATRLTPEEKQRRAQEITDRKRRYWREQGGA